MEYNCVDHRWKCTQRYKNADSPKITDKNTTFPKIISPFNYQICLIYNSEKFTLHWLGLSSDWMKPGWEHESNLNRVVLTLVTDDVSFPLKSWLFNSFNRQPTLEYAFVGQQKSKYYQPYAFIRLVFYFFDWLKLYVLYIFS